MLNDLLDKITQWLKSHHQMENELRSAQWPHPSRRKGLGALAETRRHRDQASDDHPQRGHAGIPLRVHRGQRFASTTAVAPMTDAFVRKIEQFVAREGIGFNSFEKGQRKDDVTQAYLRKFKKNEGVL